MSICATGKVCPMRTEKKIVVELTDYLVAISFRPKNPPNNDNTRYDFWSDELKELYEKGDHPDTKAESIQRYVEHRDEIWEKDPHYRGLFATLEELNNETD